MSFPYAVLRDFVETQLDAERVGDLLTMAGLLFFLGLLALLWAPWFLVLGGLRHYLSQRLLLAWHSR
jgi:hypothetical protein